MLEAEEIAPISTQSDVPSLPSDPLIARSSGLLEVSDMKIHENYAEVVELVDTPS